MSVCPFSEPGVVGLMLLFVVSFDSGGDVVVVDGLGMADNAAVVDAFSMLFCSCSDFCCACLFCALLPLFNSAKSYVICIVS